MNQCNIISEIDTTYAQIHRYRYKMLLTFTLTQVSLDQFSAVKLLMQQSNTNERIKYSSLYIKITLTIITLNTTFNECSKLQYIRKNIKYCFYLPPHSNRKKKKEPQRYVSLHFLFF